MRSDLHVHTNRSGMCTVPVLNRVCRESYNPPDAVYEILKSRGMDLVTVTDHDSIDAVEPLRRHADFFLSEEVTCTTPSGTSLHMGVYDIEERHHIGLQQRRDDLLSLIAYLREERLLFSINHVFSGLTGARALGDFAIFDDQFPAMETLNGQMPLFCNRLAAVLAERWGKPAIAGSDAHTFGSLGRTYTEVSGARNKTEFLEGVRYGEGCVRGESGNYWKLTQAVCSIGASMLREKAWTACLTPLFAAVPLCTLATWLRDFAFAAKWARRLELNHGLSGDWLDDARGGEVIP